MSLVCEAHSFAHHSHHGDIKLLIMLELLALQ